MKTYFTCPYRVLCTMMSQYKHDTLTAASTLAGLSSLGSASIDMTEIKIVSTV